MRVFSRINPGVGYVAYLLVLVLKCGTPLLAQEKPNVLFILVDDFGWYDVGYNGSTFYETPHIDKLAEQWMRFDNCYTPSPMCSPTRVSIMTGKNPARHGVTQWLPGTTKAFVRKGDAPRVFCPLSRSSHIKDKEVTLGEALQVAGYETAFYGKWHMGPLKTTGGPTNHGFHSAKAVIETNGCAMFYPFRQKRQNYFPNARKGDNFTDLITDAAIGFVQRDRDKPFFLYLAHFAMHAPIESKTDLRKRFEAKLAKMPQLTEVETRIFDDYAHKPYKRRQDEPEYAGELATLDRNIGRLIECLKSKRIYDNTIVILTGDNGGRTAFFHGAPTSVQPLRAGKTFVFEGGLRTPLLIHWPGHSHVGMRTGAPVTSMDFYPTLLEMIGLQSMPMQHVDGVSLVPLFKGQPLNRASLYWHFPHYQGEGAYPASAIRKGNLKLIINYHHDDVLLFDVVKDPGETVDLASLRPNDAKQLRLELMNYLTEVQAIIPAERK